MTASDRTLASPRRAPFRAGRCRLPLPPDERLRLDFPRGTHLPVLCLLRAALATTLSVILLAGCATTEPARSAEGQVFLRAGAAAAGAPTGEIAAGPPLRHLAVLTPSFDPAWQAAWIEGDRKPMGGEGATTGFITGLAILQATPLVFMTWPAAVGLVAGTTALGALGQHLDNAPLANLDQENRATLLTAIAALHTNRMLREAVTTALAGRMIRLPIPVLWYPTWGPDTPGTDPLAEARAQGADGVLDLAAEAFGLATGEEEGTFGVFIRIQVLILDATSGGLRYQRVLEYGPGRDVPGLPRAPTYSADFLSMDQARVFRREMQEAVERMARLLAEDPALPLAPR